MGLIRLVTFLLILMICSPCMAQIDSTIESLQQLPLQYINQLDNKIDKYSHRISSKTEKTLSKLAKWENKIKILLERTSPETAARLFSNQTTFTSLLQKLQEGKSIAENYTAKYDEYRDKLKTNMAYLQQQKDNVKSKLVKPVTEVSEKLTALEDNVKNSEALEQFIKERKRLLIGQCVQYIGKSKYLSKINAESYYYIETLRNYKSIFSDKRKAEQTALTILNKIPKFNQFVQENSMLASLFGPPSSNGGGTVASLAGLQTRASVTALIQNQITAGGPSAQQAIQNNILQAQNELNKLKDKVLKAGGSSGDMEMWDDSSPLGRRGGAPKENKTKTFKQRLELNTNFQTTKSNSYFPANADLGLSLGYKATNNLVAGVGFSYKLGLGTDISNIKLSSAGAGIRSFVDYKLKKQFFVSGGYEMNYRNRFASLSTLQNFDAWESSALLGITKKINVKTKWFKGTNLQLLYNFLYLKSVPVKQSPVVFRVGYQF
jgi:hypothetical protein